MLCESCLSASLVVIEESSDGIEYQCHVCGEYGFKEWDEDEDDRFHPHAHLYDVDEDSDD